MTLVIGTAGHIDHGKTALLRALTGIDADRLPEERRRGMTIDVGYAHLRLDDGRDVDFVDVPGHDRLIGNMLVGAGEIDAVLLVVAADDGPRAQTIEHLELLDALGVRAGLVAITKSDLVDPARLADVAEAVRMLVASTSLAGAPVIAVSSLTGDGIDTLRAAIADLGATPPVGTAGPTRLAVDRVFSVRGRGVVVTGTLRGGAIARGATLRVEPAGTEVRVRELQVHNRAVDRVEGGRAALNLAAATDLALRRGDVLTAGPGVERTDRILVALRPRPRRTLAHGLRVRVHLGTEQVDGILDRSRRASAASTIVEGEVSAVIRLERPIAAAFGDSFVLRRPSPGETLAGGRILDPIPPRGVSRRRMTAPNLLALLETPAPQAGWLTALVALHGVLPVVRAAAWAALMGVDADLLRDLPVLVAPDIRDGLRTAAVGRVGEVGGMSLAGLRSALLADLRRRATIEPDAATAVVDHMVEELLHEGRLVRDGDRALPEGASAGPGPELTGAMDRLVSVLAVAAPPTLAEAARTAGCPAAGIRALEAAGRIVRVEDDLAWETATLHGFESLAVRLATREPLTPAAFRDATGTSRRYALAILEDLGRRNVLRRTPAGHVPGPRVGSLIAAGVGGVG